MMEEAETRNRKFQHFTSCVSSVIALNKKIETLEITRDDRVESVKSRLQAELEKNEELERMHEEAKRK